MWAQQKVDMWALGCTFYYCMKLESPFGKVRHEEKVLQESVMKGIFDPLDDYYGDDLNQFVYKLLKLDPKERPRCADILDMPFVR